MNSIDVVIIDKTGTVTEGKPSVEKVISATPGFSDEDILQKIISLNSSSEHPLAQATMRYGEEKNQTFFLFLTLKLLQEKVLPECWEIKSWHWAMKS